MSEDRSMESKDPPGISDLVISQPARGYRFTSDTVALARFVRIQPWESLMDLGTGVGVIPLLVWQRSPFRFALGVELQKELADLAKENVRANALSERVFILQSDLRTLKLNDVRLPSQTVMGTGFDVAAANPPYLSLGHGRINPNYQKALARHEIELTFADLAAACRRLLKPGGHFYFVHLAERSASLAATLKSHGFILLGQQSIERSEGKTLFLAKAGLEPDAPHAF